ncbi:MAG TPA: hypothetical protein VFU88_07460 [Ktedonobacterales bacterium]|nr:hypothetical protein [Ktedonobacterales bacterium]
MRTTANRPPRRYPLVRHICALAALPLLLAGLLLSGCDIRSGGAGAAHAASAVSAIGHVAITAQDFAFHMPSAVPAGPVEFTFVNQGDQVHQAQFFHLKPGVTADQFIAALIAHGPAATRTLGAPWGGIDETMPHRPVHVIEVMVPGTYVVACLVRGSDGMPHYAMGMVGSFTVAGSGSPQPYAPPDNGTATLIEMSITLPAAISTPGEHTFKIVNAGTQVHAFDILQLAPGKTAQDVQTYLNAPSGPPPFVLLGGTGGSLPASTQWLRTSLTPGNYVAACLVVDPVTGKPHAAMGMLTAFTVA